VSVLDETFYALGDPTRRAIVARLAKSDGITVGELAKPFVSSLPAIIKHLDVLRDAGLVSRTRNGRNVICRLESKQMEEATAWINRQLNFWNQRLDALADLVESRQETSHDDQKRTRRRRRRSDR
jgi:DNA-binding transcriptional ArsR family regulator